MRTQREVISSVNHLIEVCNERILGYRKASEKVNDPALSSLFEQYARQTEGFARELAPFSDEYEASNVGTRPIGDGWRLWMDLKSALTNGDRISMIEACLTGENSAIRNYEEALEEDLPSGVKAIVLRQWREIKQARQDIKMRKF